MHSNKIMIKPCIQQHFHQLHKLSKFRRLHDADSQTEMPSNELASLSLLVTEWTLVVSSECWGWTSMTQVVNQNASAEMMILIPERTCETVNQSLMLHKQTACFSAFLFKVYKHISHAILVHGQVTIIFVVSVCLFVCLSVCLYVCAEFFSAVFDPIWIKLGHMLHVRV